VRRKSTRPGVARREVCGPNFRRKRPGERRQCVARGLNTRDRYICREWRAVGPCEALPGGARRAPARRLRPPAPGLGGALAGGAASCGTFAPLGRRGALARRGIAGGGGRFWRSPPPAGIFRLWRRALKARRHGAEHRPARAPRRVRADRSPVRWGAAGLGPRRFDYGAFATRPAARDRPGGPRRRSAANTSSNDSRSASSLTSAAAQRLAHQRTVGEAAAPTAAHCVEGFGHRTPALRRGGNSPNEAQQLGAERVSSRARGERARFGFDFGAIVLVLEPTRRARSGSRRGSSCAHAQAQQGARPSRGLAIEGRFLKPEACAMR